MIITDKWTRYDRTDFTENIESLIDKLEDAEMESDDMASVLCAFIYRLTGDEDTSVRPIAQGRYLGYTPKRSSRDDLFDCVDRIKDLLGK